MILLYKMVCWGVKGLESWDLFKPGQQIMWIPFIHLLTNKCLVLYRSVRVSVYLNYFSTLSNLQASCFENNTFYLLYKSADSWFPIICCWQHSNLCINSIPAQPVLQLSLRFRSSFEGHVLQKRFFYSKKKNVLQKKKQQDENHEIKFETPSHDSLGYVIQPLGGWATAEVENEKEWVRQPGFNPGFITYWLCEPSMPQFPFLYNGLALFLELLWDINKTYSTLSTMPGMVNTKYHYNL